MKNGRKFFLDIDSNNYTQYIADKKFFSVGYGSNRRFTGGDSEIMKLFENRTKVNAHLSAFEEKVALTEPINWLIDKAKDIVISQMVDKMKQLRISNPIYMKEEDLAEVLNNIAHVPIIDDFKKLLNSTGFLPNNTTLEDVSSNGVFFRDANDNLITVTQLSSGYVSVISLTLELIRQLVDVYGEEAVFENIQKDDMRITLPGVVLIDEIDAHLHPTWQTKIGQWFLKYFPNLQFIVTTHSPLVCRAAEKGTIWKLAAPGSEEKSGQVTGVDRQRLIYGNILDAYGTEVFGEDVSRSEKSAEMLKELAALSVKSFKGKITDNERKRADQLKQILPTE